MTITSNDFKRAYVSKLLEHGIVKLLIDARCEGVIVPAAYRNSASLLLNFSWHFAPRDLYLTDQRIRSTLSFDGADHNVSIPWEAVIGAGRPKGKNFDRAQNVLFVASGALGHVVVDDVLGQLIKPQAQRPTPTLRVIKGGRSEDEDEGGDADADGADDPNGPRVA